MTQGKARDQWFIRSLWQLHFVGQMCRYVCLLMRGRMMEEHRGRGVRSHHSSVTCFSDTPKWSRFSSMPSPGQISLSWASLRPESSNIPQIPRWKEHLFTSTTYNRVHSVKGAMVPLVLAPHLLKKRTEGSYPKHPEWSSGSALLAPQHFSELRNFTLQGAQGERAGLQTAGNRWPLDREA